MAGEGAKSVAKPPRGPGDSNYGLGLLSGGVRKDGGREVERRMRGEGGPVESKDAMIFVKRHNCTLRRGTRVIVPSPTTTS